MCVAVIDTAGEVRGLAVDLSLSDELVDEGVGAKVSTLATKKRRVEEPMPRGLLSVVPNLPTGLAHVTQVYTPGPRSLAHTVGPPATTPYN